MTELTAGEIAEFDQSFKASEDILMFLVESYREVRAENEQAGVPVPVTISALAGHLITSWDIHQTSSALAAAVVLLDAYLAESGM